MRACNLVLDGEPLLAAAGIQQGGVSALDQRFARVALLQHRAPDCYWRSALLGEGQPDLVEAVRRSQVA
jgi:hypothetical protein